MSRFVPLLLLSACASAPAQPRDPRQLTSDGTHAEAYFSFDGTKIVLMGERAGDKADQIYVLDLAEGGLARVSNGQGKAT